MVLLLLCLIKFNIPMKESGCGTYLVRRATGASKQKQPLNSYQLNLSDQVGQNDISNSGGRFMLCLQLQSSCQIFSQLVNFSTAYMWSQQDFHIQTSSQICSLLFQWRRFSEIEKYYFLCLWKVVTAGFQTD